MRVINGLGNLVAKPLSTYNPARAGYSDDIDFTALSPEQAQKLSQLINTFGASSDAVWNYRVSIRQEQINEGVIPTTASRIRKALKIGLIVTGIAAVGFGVYRFSKKSK